jgi:hypothetical protein
MVEGASLDWVAHRDLERGALAQFLQDALVRTVQAALADAPVHD